MDERIGFYICHCGINIAYKVRVAEVSDYIRKIPGVAVSRDYLFMCSDPGQELIEKDIRKHGLTRVVVASCSPRMHEMTFREACRRAGLNPYRSFHMVCVREHVSWVTKDQDEATEKAKQLSRAGVLRVRFQKDLFPSRFPVNTATLIVGGGIAGMQAALDVAKAGYKAILVEKQPTIGGHMLQYDKTFPTLDCAACIGTPKMVSVGQDPNIELLTNSEVESVDGFIGNFNVKVRKRARFVTDNCTGCGECANVCPVVTTNEWDVHTLNRKAIYRSFPQAVPIQFLIDKADRPPCVQACPAGTNVQGYIALIKQEKYMEAVQLIMRNIPLPGTLGRICPAPCEKVCRRAEIDEPIAIRQLKRFAVDQIDWDALPLPICKEAESEARIAIAGSGPAGLSCAYFLTLEGYRVDIYESAAVTGGMLRVGIPDYRLPAEILDREIAFIERMGVNIKLNSPIGKEHTIDHLFEEGYEAVYLAPGAHESSLLKIPNEKAEGVVNGVTYLREINTGAKPVTGKNVIVMGGGDVAIDAARVALRNGAQSVKLVYRRSRDEMPAQALEIKAAEDEGVQMIFLAAPMEAKLSSSGLLSGLKCQRMQLEEPDESGRRRPVPIEGDTIEMECDMLIPAIGQLTSTSILQGSREIEVDKWGAPVVDPVTFETSRSGLFAGGDFPAGPSLAIAAVSAGKEAARSIMCRIQGQNLYDNRPSKPAGEKWAPIPENAKKHNRAVMPEIVPAERKGSFDEVEQGFSLEAGLQEASRCINCGVCSECGLCVDACEAKAINHSMVDEIHEYKVGSIIVATGFDVLDPSVMAQYGYGRFSNVFTNLEFERLSNATGPTAGKLLKRDSNDRLVFTEPPKSVAILHCIGSRDKNYHSYCSRTCCMYALKYAHLLKEKCGPDTEIYNFYIDMRCFGKGYEEFFERVQREGVRMIRGKAAGVVEKDDMLIVSAEDTLAGQRVDIPVEMVILCTAMEPRADASRVASTFGLTIGGDGFFLEEHPKLEPVSTPTSGVFIAGACQSPKDIPDTVAQAKGATAEALALSSCGEVMVPPMIAAIDPQICVGCQVCKTLCPYSAIEYNAFQNICQVNEAVCKGCGSCASYCPSGASKIRQFTDKQVFAEIDGLLTYQGAKL